LRLAAVNPCLRVRGSAKPSSFLFVDGERISDDRHTVRVPGLLDGKQTDPDIPEHEGRITLEWITPATATPGPHDEGIAGS
jgi:hypothetical protein